MSRKTTALMLLMRAYIDPGTGWIIITGLLGAVTSVAYAVRTCLGRAKQVFSFGSAESAGGPGSAPPADKPEPDIDQD